MNFSQFLKLLLISIFSLLILLLSTALVIGYFYEEEVKQLLVGEINKQLVTPVSVKGINLSLLKKFPNASLEFTDVSAESVQSLDSLSETEPIKERLFEAHKIFLQFNILDIFHKKYHIKKLEIEEAKVNLFINKKGQDNYHFWKKSADTTGSTFKLNLENIAVLDADIVYKNENTEQLFSFVIKKSNLIGNFSESNYTIDTRGEYYVEDIRVNGTSYLKRKSILLAGSLEVSHNSKFEFKNVALQVNELEFNLNGAVASNENKATEVDINIDGKNLSVKTFISMLPEESRKKLTSYSSSGLFYFETRINGEVGEGARPKITAKFGIKNGEVNEESSDLTLERVDLIGTYNNGKNRSNSSSELTIANFSAFLGKGKIVGNFSIKNFENPYLKILAEAQLNLSQVKQFLKLDTLEKFSGNLILDLDFSGNTSHIAHFSASDFAKTKTQGTLTLEQGNIKFTGAKQNFENLNASLMFNNNDIVVNECNGKIEDSDFALKGFFRNALATVFNQNEKLFIDASLTSRKINLNQILADDEASTKNKKAFELKFSERINFNLNVAVGELVFKKFAANNISGTVKLQDKKLALSPITFATMDGTVLANGVIDGTSGSGFKAICDADLRNITISKLFFEFENFGGTTLTDKNLKGKASASIQFSGDFTAELQSKTESIVSRFELTIENGELLNFEPLRKLSRFISLSELNNIRFASLKNSIEIKNRNIIVPKMEINSSAINLSVAGTHTFDNVVDYHFKVLLNDLLGKKARKAKPENEEFGTIEEDGLGKTAIYISMIGPLDNPKISYDKSGLKMQLKQYVASETNSLKSILKNEFGWFKKDSTLKAAAPKKQSAKFEMEWEEAAEKSSDKANKEMQLPKVKAENTLEEEKKKIKVLDNLFKKAEEKPKKKKEKKEKTENSDDFN